MPIDLLQFDSDLFNIIYFLPHPLFLVLMMELFSLAGYFGFVWFVIAFFQKKFRPVAIALVCIFLFVDILLKFLVHRERPYPSYLDNFLPWGSFSFPSGHAAASFAAAYILIKGKIQKTKQKNLLPFLIWMLAIIISFSRVYLGRHYPLDIIAGGIIGWGIGFLINSKLKFKL